MRTRPQCITLRHLEITLALVVVHAFWCGDVARAQFFRAGTEVVVEHRSSQGDIQIDRDEENVGLPIGAAFPRDLLSASVGANSDDFFVTGFSQYQETLLGGDFGVHATGTGLPGGVANFVRSRAKGKHFYELLSEDFPVPIQDIRMQSFVPIDGIATATQIGLASDPHARVVVDWGYLAILRGRIPGGDDDEPFDDYLVSANVDGTMTFSSVPGQQRPEISVSGALADDVTFAEVLHQGIIPAWSAEGASMVDLALGQVSGLDYQLTVVYSLETTVEFFDEAAGYEGAAAVADFLNTGSYELSLVDLDGNPIPGVEFIPIGLPEPNSAALGILALGAALLSLRGVVRTRPRADGRS